MGNILLCDYEEWLDITWKVLLFPEINSIVSFLKFFFFLNSHYLSLYTFAIFVEAFVFLSTSHEVDLLLRHRVSAEIEFIIHLMLWPNICFQQVFIQF